MASAPFGFAGLAGPTLRRSVVDPLTGAPVITSAPTGQVVQRAGLLPVGRDDSGNLVPAVPQGLFDAIDAARFPDQVYRGEKGVFDPATGHVSDEAVGKAIEIAGSAMAGSSPFSAPKGALRSFGGAAAKDDPLAALEAGLADFAKLEDPIPDAPGALRPARLDPDAASWDLYHGSEPGLDFQRFDPFHGKQHSERGAVFFAPRAETANGYAGTPKADAEAGSRVYRTTVEPGRTRVFDLADMAENDPAFNARAKAIASSEGGSGWNGLFDSYLDSYRQARARDRDIGEQVRQMGYVPGEMGGVSFGYGHIGAAVQMAKEQGLDTAILRGLAEHGGDDQVIALTPGRVRSYYAPDQLLYSGGPGGAAAAALTSPDQAQAAPGAAPMSAGIPFGFGDIATAIDPRRRPMVPYGNPDVVLPSELPGVEIPTRATEAPPVQAPAPSAGLATSFLGAPDIAWPGAQAPVAPAPAPEPEATASVAPKPVRLPTITAPAPTAVSPAPVSPAPTPSPVSAPAATTAAADDDNSGPSFANFRANGGMSTLGAIGIGLLGSPTMAGGLSAGLQLAQRNESTRAATDLAKVELGLKRRKLAAEEAATGGNASILQRAYPWMSPAQAVAGASNSSLVTDALKIIRDPNSGRQMAEDSSGVRRWTDTGQPIFEGDTGKSFEMVPEEERVRLGLPAGSYQRESNNKVSPVNPTGTTINMGAEKAQDAEIGKEYGKQYIGYQTAGRNAGAKLNSLALMEQAMKMPGFYSGAGGDAVRRANQFLGALGVKDPKAASGAEVFGALSNQVVLDQLGGSLGPGVSNTDRDYIGRVAPGLEKTPEGNRQIIGIYRNLAKREQVVAQMARNYATKNGGRLDAGFDQEMAAFAEANPLFPQAKDGATANPPQDRRSVGGKTYLRGPDGWYEE